MPSLAACLSGKDFYLIPQKKRRRYRSGSPKERSSGVIDYGPVGDPSNYSDYSIDSGTDTEPEDPNREVVHLTAEFFSRNLSQCTSVEKKRRPARRKAKDGSSRGNVLLSRLKRRLTADPESSDSETDVIDELFGKSRLGQRLPPHKSGSGRTVNRMTSDSTLKHGHPNPGHGTSSSKSPAGPSHVFLDRTPTQRKKDPSLRSATATATVTASTAAASTASSSRSEVTTGRNCSLTIPTLGTTSALQQPQSLIDSPLIESVPKPVTASAVTVTVDSDDDCVDVTPVRLVDPRLQKRENLVSKQMTIDLTASESKSGRTTSVSRSRKNHPSTASSSQRGSIEKFLIKKPKIVPIDL